MAVLISTNETFENSTDYCIRRVIGTSECHMKHNECPQLSLVKCTKNVVFQTLFVNYNYHLQKNEFVEEE